MRPARGFSLVELTVVIGIVVLLAGLTLSAGTAVVRNAEHRTTATVLTQLEVAVREWELQADRKLSWWQYNDDFDRYNAIDVHSDTSDVLILTEILNVVTRNAAGRDLIAHIDPELIYRYEDDTAPWLSTPMERSDVNDRFLGSITVLDAWGTPIYATHPGRPWTTADGQPGYSLQRDQDGTIRTFNEERYGIAPNRSIVFVSAGPDQRFGLPAEFPPLALEAMQDARLDNIYSIPVSFVASGY